MKITQDFHIHSHHSCDSACSTLKDIRADREARGITGYAVTDHLHTRYNLCDIESARNDFLGMDPPPEFQFGIEITCMAAWECERIAAGDYQVRGDVPIYGFRDDEHPFDGRLQLDITGTEIARLGISVVVGGVHWPAGMPRTRSEAIDNYFAQEMFLATHPLVHIIAHPWWSLELAAGDWFRHRDQAHIDWEVFRNLPLDFIDRLGGEIRRNGKLAEINLGLLADEPDFVTELRFQWFRRWKDTGVKFTIGSDQHGTHPNDELFWKAERLLDHYGFTEADFVLPGINHITIEEKL